METLSLDGGNYFAIAIGIFFTVYGAIVLYRGQVMSDPSERFEGKVIVGFRARLMGFIVIILGISVVGFGLVAI